MAALERTADGCLLPGFVGTRAPDWVLRRLAGGLGGVVLYGRNVVSPAQVADLTAQLRAGRPDAVVAIDEEGGDVTRLEAVQGSSYPGNLALGAIDDVALTRSLAASMGSELASAGIGLDLAPVADVNSNPDNPVIGVRSFGSEPGLVARHTAAFVAGLQSRGVAACAKHFPGHGDTSIDSHVGLPVAPDGAGALEIALAPFRAAIAAGVRSIMTAHVVLPRLDTRPATVSRPILTGLLRERLGFGGLIVTDALEMAAVGQTVGFEEGAVLALAAGADALCVGGGFADEDVVTRLREALVRAVSAGRLEEQRLAEAAARVASVARWARTARSLEGGLPGPDRALGEEAARRAILAEGVSRLTGPPLVAELSPEPTLAVGTVAWGVGAALAARDPSVEVRRFEGAPDSAALVAAAAGRALVLVVRDLHRHAWQAATADAVLRLRPDTILVEMGLPAHRPERARAYIATRGAARVCGSAAADLLAAGEEARVP